MRYSSLINKLFSSSWLYIVVLAILCYAPVVKFLACDNCYLGTTGDFVSIPNIKEFFANTFTSLDMSYYGGAGRSYRLPQYLPYYLTIRALNTLGLDASISDALFFFSTVFFNTVSVFIYIKHVLSTRNAASGEKNTNYYLAFIGALLFTVAPFFTNFIRAGHFLLFPMFGSFALVLYFFEKAQTLSLERKKSWKIYVNIFLLFFIIPLPFANIGYIVSFFLCFGLYTISYAIVFSKRVLESIKIYITFLLLFILSNIWWLLPVSLTIGDLSYHEELSRNTLGQYIDVATEYSTPTNIFFGQPEGPISLDKLITSDLTQSIVYLGYSLLFLSAVYVITFGSKQKNNRVYVFLTSILLITVLIKGPRSPFPFLFNYFYENVGLMQIFRRPSSKVYFFSLLMTTTLSLYILSGTYSKLSKSYRYGINFSLLILVLIFYNIFLLRLEYLREFSIPNEYYEIRKYLGNQDTKKILILPDIGENPVLYDKSLNNISGVDFLNYFFPYPILSPNHDLLSNNEFYAKLSAIEHSADYAEFCDATMKFRVSHILVKKNIKNRNYGLSYEQLTKRFESYKNLENVKGFGVYTDVYRVEDKCTDSIVKVNTSSSAVPVAKLSETFFMSKDNLAINDNVSVTLAYHKDTNWKLLLVPDGNCGISCLTKNLRWGINDSNDVSYNSWQVTKGSQNLPYRVVIIFLPDLFLYFCFALTSVLSTAVLFITLHSYRKFSKISS